MPMPIFRSHGALASPLCALLLGAGLLAGCANDDSTARFFVAPGKYVLYDCTELKQASLKTAAREHELEGLMAKADIGAGGGLVNAVAYRPEYDSLRGDMMDLRQAAIDKKCDFVPGMESAGGAAQNDSAQ